MKQPRKIYSPEVQEVRAAQVASGLRSAALARKIGVKTWEMASLLSGANIRPDRVNKIRAALKLPPLQSLKPPLPKPVAARVIATPARSTHDDDDLLLPTCDWSQVAVAAAELSTASADYQFASNLFREAAFKLRAAKRLALAAGIAVAPTLTGGGGKSLQASKNTTQFFKLLSVGGALS